VTPLADARPAYQLKRYITLEFDEYLRQYFYSSRINLFGSKYYIERLFSAAGKDLWENVKEGSKGLRRGPMEVPVDFKASLHPVSNCTWIHESNIKNKEKQKWKYYPHPKTKGKYYRTVNKGNQC
jgi:hypothetical protein